MHREAASADRSSAQLRRNFFGPKNLPKLGKMFGKTMKNFKEGMDDVDDNGEVKKTETQSEDKAEKKDEE